MMNKINVAVTGYYGTGSSAVIDLLKEYKDVSIVPVTGEDYEHSVFFVPGGLFELCAKLLHGISPQGSDMAINNFVDAMKRLNDNDFGWFGSYEKMFGDKFMIEVDKFVNNISTVRSCTNSNHSKKVRFSLIKAVAQLFVHIFTGKKIVKYGRWYVEDGKKVYFSMPSSEEFYKAAKEFTSSYCHLFQTPPNTTHAIFDHLIWPQQVDEFANCFEDNLKVIIVERDPRDVYILDQYLWSVPPIGYSKAHFSSNLLEFIDEWERTVTATSNSNNILKIHFEDLIYNYEETVNVIENFIKIDANKHQCKKHYFCPEKSIENTQVFHLKKEWESIATEIAKKLPDTLYSFPRERIPQKNKIFA